MQSYGIIMKEVVFVARNVHCNPRFYDKLSLFSLSCSWQCCRFGNAFLQISVTFDACVGLLCRVLVTLFFAVSIACSAGHSFDEHRGMEEGYVVLLLALSRFLAESEFVLMFLTPLDNSALVVLFLFLHLFDVDDLAKDFLVEELVAVVVTTVYVDGSDEGFEGVAAHETVVPCGDGACMANQLVKP